MPEAKRRKMDEGSALPVATTPATGPSKDLPTYLLLVLRGLEFLVVEEIREKLQVEYVEICSVQKDPKNKNMNVYEGEAAAGRVILQTRSSLQEVKALNSVQAVLALLAKSDEIVTTDASGVKQVVELTMGEDNWAPAMQLWKEHMRTLRPDTFNEDDEPIFRGSCVRDGRHAFKSVEIAAQVGDAIGTKFKWKVDLTKFTLEVVCIIFYHSMVVAISLADPVKYQFRNRMISEDRSIITDSKYVSTLRPSTTYLMLQLAKYEVGDVLMDSMCGVGTIPICAAELTNNTIFAIGGELEPIPVEKAGQNAGSRTRNVDIYRWDSTRLPLRSESVDKVVIDLPFGVNCGTPRQLSKIYPKIMHELYRVMRPNSRAVLLTALKKTFMHSVALVPWKLVHSYDVNIGGLQGGVYVIEKA